MVVLLRSRTKNGRRGLAVFTLFSSAMVANAYLSNTGAATRSNRRSLRCPTSLWSFSSLTPTSSSLFDDEPWSSSSSSTWTEQEDYNANYGYDENYGNSDGYGYGYDYDGEIQQQQAQQPFHFEPFAWPPPASTYRQQLYGDDDQPPHEKHTIRSYGSGGNSFGQRIAQPEASVGRSNYYKHKPRGRLYQGSYGSMALPGQSSQPTATRQQYFGQGGVWQQRTDPPSYATGGRSFGQPLPQPELSVGRGSSKTRYTGVVGGSKPEDTKRSPWSKNTNKSRALRPYYYGSPTIDVPSRPYVGNRKDDGNNQSSKPRNPLPSSLPPMTTKSSSSLAPKAYPKPIVRSPEPSSNAYKSGYSNSGSSVRPRIDPPWARKNQDNNNSNSKSAVPMGLNRSGSSPERQQVYRDGNDSGNWRSKTSSSQPWIDNSTNTYKNDNKKKNNNNHSSYNLYYKDDTGESTNGTKYRYRRPLGNNNSNADRYSGRSSRTSENFRKNRDGVFWNTQQDGEANDDSNGGAPNEPSYSSSSPNFRYTISSTTKPERNSKNNSKNSSNDGLVENDRKTKGPKPITNHINISININAGESNEEGYYEWITEQ